VVVGGGGKFDPDLGAWGCAWTTFDEFVFIFVSGFVTDLRVECWVGLPQMPFSLWSKERAAQEPGGTGLSWHSTGVDCRIFSCDCSLAPPTIASIPAPSQLHQHNTYNAVLINAYHGTFLHASHCRGSQPEITAVAIGASVGGEDGRVCFHSPIHIVW